MSTYKKSACPALNILRKSGEINSSGKDITDEELISALQRVFNVNSAISKTIIEKTKNACGIDENSTIDLEEISKHNCIEHDASLFHSDYEFDKNQTEVNILLIEDLISFSEDGENITWDELVKFKNTRIHNSKSTNPNFLYEFNQKVTSFGEMFLLMNILGRNGSISIEDLKTFLIEEKLPEKYVPPESINYFTFIYNFILSLWWGNDDTKVNPLN